MSSVQAGPGAGLEGGDVPGAAGAPGAAGECAPSGDCRLRVSGLGKQAYTCVTAQGPADAGRDRRLTPGHLALSCSSTYLGTGVSESLSHGPGWPRTPVWSGVTLNSWSCFLMLGLQARRAPTHEVRVTSLKTQQERSNMFL